MGWKLKVILLAVFMVETVKLSLTRREPDGDRNLLNGENSRTKINSLFTTEVFEIVAIVMFSLSRQVL